MIDREDQVAPRDVACILPTTLCVCNHSDLYHHAMNASGSHVRKTCMHYYLQSWRSPALVPVSQMGP